MNKHLLFAGMAAAMLMTSCSTDDDLSNGNGGQNGQVGNSDIPVMLSVGQTPNHTRLVLGNTDQNGNYDGTFDAKGLGIYCLATGKIAGKEDINWRQGYDNPNFLWMQNVKADAETTATPVEVLGRKVTNLSFYDANGQNKGTNYFYPMGSQYSYSFYGYYPYSQNVNHDGNQFSIDVTGLNGCTDLIWGKSEVADDDEFADDAFSAKYFRDWFKKEGEKNWDKNIKKHLPNVKFQHKLMKFNIILKKGSGESTQLNLLGIKSAKLMNVATGGTLVIADLDNADNEGKFTVDWNTASNLEEDALVLKKTVDGKDMDLSEGEGGYPGPFIGEGREEVTIGSGFLVPVPTYNGDGTYVDNGYAGTDQDQLKNQGIFRLRVDYYLTSNPDQLYKAAQYEIRPVFTGVNEGDATWEEGYEYDIVISVSDPQLIGATATLTPWNKRTIELE